MTPFPRVTLPGIEPSPEVEAMIRAHDEHQEHIARQKKGIAYAMVALGKPVFRPRRRPRRRPTAHVRHARRMAARAYYLRGS